MTAIERSARRQTVTWGNGQVNFGHGNLPEQSRVGQAPDIPEATKTRDNARKRIGPDGPGSPADDDRLRDELQKALAS